MLHSLFPRWLALGLALAASLVSSAGAGSGPLDVPTHMTPFLADGYAIRWNHVTNQMVYMKPGADGYYGLYLLDPDGKNERPLTNPLLPGKHAGVPFWHPSGRYVLFVAEKKEHPGRSSNALPGFGGYSDMWLITPDGKSAWKLVEEPVDAAHGMLLPTFSPDGKKVAWCERVVEESMFRKMKVAGLTVIHVADFLEAPTPHVANIRDFQPGGDAFYEASCFLPDSNSLLISSNFETKNFWTNQIYRLDLTNGTAHRLTHDEAYNEHPGVTPDGNSIIWMSNAYAYEPGGLHGTDWWMMDLDGGNPRRISTMNVKDSPQADGEPKWAGTVAWSADGTWFYGDVQTNLLKQTGKVVRVELPAKDVAKKSKQAAAAADNGQPTIRIASGLISGALLGEKGDIFAYKGVPFAAAPMGDLRWRPPQPAKPWDGVRACTEFGPACPQPKVFLISNEITRTDEDCLNLNVWAPANAEGKNLPVMVWIHGGAFTIGANYQGWFNGENMARQGVVVVAINYRLGPLGFLAHPLLSKESAQNASGNYGLLDQIFALQWVRKNIAAFGGDKNNVTIFGESAGGASVALLLVSPLTNGLFQHAIAESGGARNAYRHVREKWYGKEPMEGVGEYYAKYLKCDSAASVLTVMRGKSVDDLFKASEAAKSQFGGETSWPIVDGWVIPDDPLVLFEQGRAHDVPFMTGSNADEIGSIIGDMVVRGDFEKYADDVFKLFPGDSRKRAGTVAVFGSTARADAQSMSKHSSSKAYLYQFARAAPSWRFMGAFHSSEIPYVFGNQDPKLKWEARDKELSATMMSYWINFAKTGAPNAPGLPKWPAYDAKTDLHMELGDVVEAQSGLDKPACDGIDRIRAERLKNRSN